MKTKAFFGESGLTSTSANHYANLAKEMARNGQNYLTNVVFYSTKINVIGGESGGVISEGVKDDDLPTIEQTIQQIGELNSLIAFFREAMKEKDRLGTEAASWEDVDGRAEFEEKGRELQARKPKRGTYLTEEGVKQGWSIGEQEKYLSLEAEASVLGKYIHEDGYISNARQDLMRKLSNPKAVKENGRDTIIYDYIPTASMIGVDEMFFKLQARHREVQAELNGMKKKVEDALRANKLKVDEEYRLAMAEWNREYNALEREYSEIIEKEGRQRQLMAEQVNGLKIVVPNRLKGIFETLQSLK